MPKDANRNKRGAEDGEAGVVPETDAEADEAGLDKKNGLDTFTSFYLPKLQSKRSVDGLNSFSTFYVPRTSGRAKRNSLDSFSSFYRLPIPSQRSRSRRSVLRSFSGFYLPSVAHDDYEY